MKGVMIDGDFIGFDEIRLRALQLKGHSLRGFDGDLLGALLDHIEAQRPTPTRKQVEAAIKRHTKYINSGGYADGVDIGESSSAIMALFGAGGESALDGRVKELEKSNALLLKQVKRLQLRRITSGKDSAK